MGAFSVRYSREFFITVIVIAEFDSNCIEKLWTNRSDVEKKLISTYIKMRSLIKT